MWICKWYLPLHKCAPSNESYNDTEGEFCWGAPSPLLMPKKIRTTNKYVTFMYKAGAHKNKKSTCSVNKWTWISEDSKWSSAWNHRWCHSWTAGSVPLCLLENPNNGDYIVTVLSLVVIQVVFRLLINITSLKDACCQSWCPRCWEVWSCSCARQLNSKAVRARNHRAAGMPFRGLTWRDIWINAALFSSSFVGSVCAGAVAGCN